MTRRRGAAVLGAAAGIGLLVPVFGGTPWLVYNASGSAPLGFYVRSVQPAGMGDYVLVRADSGPAIEAARRGLVPAGMPLVKRLAAGPGDRVCRTGTRVSVNGRVIVEALHRDRSGRRLPVWSGCRQLGSGDSFLLQDHPLSFDGRYFGITPASAVGGRLVPVGSGRFGPEFAP